MKPQATLRDTTGDHAFQRQTTGAIRRHILIVSPVWQQAEFGGPDVSFLAARLSKEGQTVSLLSCCRFGDTLSVHRRRSIFGTAQKLRELYRRVVACDVVYLQATPPLEMLRSLLPALLLARFFGKQTVISFAGGNVEDLTGKSARILIPMLRLATRIIVPTEWSARILAKYHLPVEVVPTPVDTVNSPRLIQEVQPRILSFLLAGPDSNLTSILRAVRLAKQKYPRVELTLVAGGEKLSLAVAQTIQDNFVTLIDSSDQEAIRRSLENCDLLVNNSTDDDLPTPILQALNLGIPVISCDSGGMTAVIQNRQSGLIFPANDPVSLAGRIIELIEQPALVTQLSRSGPLEARRFAWSAVRGSWIPLFNRYRN